MDNVPERSKRERAEDACILGETVVRDRAIRDLTWSIHKDRAAHGSMMLAIMDLCVGAWMTLPFEMAPPPLPVFFASHEFLWGLVFMAVGALRLVAYRYDIARLRRWADFMAMIIWGICTAQFLQIGWSGIALPMTFALTGKNIVAFVVNSRRRMDEHDAD